MAPKDARILELYQAGYLIKAIATEVGMAPNTVGSILKRLGVERPAKPQKRWRGQPHQDAKICELWDLGLCASQIAERLGLSRSAVDVVLTANKSRPEGSARHRYDSSSGGGSGRDGFAGNMARKT